MKILAINGSPRKGNIEFMLHEILRFTRKKSVDVSAIKLRKRNINFCDANDDGCPKTGKCDIHDDMQHIYQELEKADIVILASPTYFSNVTAHMKKFIDRCNPYYFNKKLKGKGFFLIAVGGYEPSIKETIRCMRNFLKGIYAKEIGSYYTIADKISEVEKNSKVIKELEEIAIKPVSYTHLTLPTTPYV